MWVVLDGHYIPKRPARGVGGTGRGLAAEAIFGVGAKSGLGFQVDQAGCGGLETSGAGAGAAGAMAFGASLSLLFFSGLLYTVLQAGLAGAGGASAAGGAGSGAGAGGASILGFQSGEYSPPAPCFDLRLINSAISY